MRLIHNNWSLFYRVYKARYSPNTSFLDAELGNNPSFVWRSLLAARDIIHTGSRWTIGDGRNVSVASHSWLPHSPVFLNTPSQDMKVIDLIDKDTWQWDRGKLFATYDRRTCESILALPLTHQNSHDKLIWKENRSQRFTVRSAYQVALRLKYPNQAEHSSVQAHVRVHLEEAMEVKRTTKGPYLPMEGMLRMSTHKGESPQKTDQSRRKMRAVPSP